MEGLTIEFIPYFEIENLKSDERIDRLLAIVKENKVVLLEGRLKKTEETELIARTMAMIDDDFKGIELAVVDPMEVEDSRFIHGMKKRVIDMILGDRQGFTVVGPAAIIKEIKKDPNKVQLLTEEIKAPKRARKKKKK